jgi:hypothetical protein
MNQTRLTTESATSKESPIGEVKHMPKTSVHIEEVAARYISSWKNITDNLPMTRWMVNGVMSDIEFWIEGDDPNESFGHSGLDDFDPAQLRALYSLLAPIAVTLGYIPGDMYMIRE